MLPIPGYQVLEKLYESERSVIYRAQRHSDQESVLLKVLRQEYPSPVAVARLQREYDILRHLEVEGVIKAYALEIHQQRPILVLEDFGGKSLQTWLHDRSFNLEEFLTLAIQVTSILGDIHQHNLIHKDINPSNIVLNPATGQVKLIDFGIATVLSQESPPCNPHLLEGTLPYMSPEQTGRMNRVMDYRTDFYSLGVTFYQLLCDRLPFEATNTLELVHCHLARQPVPPHEFGEQRTGDRKALYPSPFTLHPLQHPTRDTPPKVVSDLVMKLLSKNAEDRYQSAHSLKADLQECLNQLQQTQQIESFPVGRWDLSSSFPPQTLYGREQEVAALLAAFERRRYPQPFDRLSERAAITTQSRYSSSTASSSTETVALDFAALMKALQALSNEIVLDKLLAKLMTILMENAGAQRGCLLLESQGKLQIEAEANVELESISLLQAIPMASEAAKNLLPLAIVTYVARTQESIVLNQAAQDYRFNQDTYILNHQPKSILCTPLIHQGKLSGILYLENNLTLDAFTPERLQLLQFLSTQAAISIGNARAYNQLERRVQERTVELTQANDRLQREILERQRSEQTLRMIVEGTASVTGVDFFRSLVRSLAQALNVRYAFISECMDAAPTRVRSFAFWQGDAFGDAFEYDLHGTPCERIINSKNYQCFPDQIQSFFPEDKDLEAMQAKSYAGIALLNSNGNLLGHLAVLDEQPLENESRTQAVLEIFAARAAAEMERKQAEDALRVSETKFSTAFRSSPDAITISTLKDGCYIEVNDSFLRMLGYDREEILGRSALNLGVWAKPDDQDAIMQLLHQQSSVTNLEIRFRRKSGEIFPVLFSAEVIHLENEPCLLAVAADITMLKQAEKALERLAEIGELAAMIVHEVRNPLTTILMGLNAFKNLQLSERFQEYLSLSLDEADRLKRLLNQILLYARPQTLQRSHLELNNFISETLTALQTLPVASGKHLRAIAFTESVSVLADSDKLKQVFINLVTNACEAVKEGEAITVQMQKTEKHHVCIQVHNGGVPIPADVLPKLAKPFFTTKASGTGLGLAIVKRIVEAHDGEFNIKSSAMTGTIVNVKLPLARESFRQNWD